MPFADPQQILVQPGKHALASEFDLPSHYNRKHLYKIQTTIIFQLFSPGSTR